MGSSGIELNTAVRVQFRLGNDENNRISKCQIEHIFYFLRLLIF